MLRITKLTAHKFGKLINPHLFRDCAATGIAIHDPENVGISPGVLGHRSYATSEKYYNLARGLEAGMQFNGFIQALRRLCSILMLKRIISSLSRLRAATGRRRIAGNQKALIGSARLVIAASTSKWNRATPTAHAIEAHPAPVTDRGSILVGDPDGAFSAFADKLCQRKRDFPSFGRSNIPVAAPAELLTERSADQQHQSKVRDRYPRNHPDRSDDIDGAIGELSAFHQTHGYYAQGVSPETAVLADVWQDRSCFSAFPPVRLGQPSDVIRESAIRLAVRVSLGG